ncbi:MAG: SMC family ATPase [Bryobacteraceae bacterium]|nr:SMC family ATPase [Bryobacteraceae bacterium]MDW8377353.1 SMC family ATPase [Bryobacterales bacterium]
MRPIKLTLEGFTCYQRLQEIDFTRSRVFAIAGPTGAGKSSLLDAMTFALFGRVPRLGGRKLEELISLGVARTAVRFEFEAGAKHYRVVRTMSRTQGKKRAQLEEGPTNTPLADGVDEVDRKLRAILGLDYDAFVRCVLLPQGDFAKFLKSEPSKRRQILQDLLRLGVYDRMRELAAGEASQLASRIQEGTRTLEERYAQATPEFLAEKKKALEQAQANRAQGEAALERLRRELERLARIWQDIQKRERALQRRSDLEQRKPLVNDAKQEIERATSAQAVLEKLAAASEKKRDCEAFQLEVKKLETELSDALQQAAQTARALKEAEAEAQNLDMKRRRLLELAKVVPQANERHNWMARRTELFAEKEKACAAFHQQQARLEAAQKRLQQAEQRYGDLVSAQQATGYDAVAYRIFNQARAAAIALKNLREDVERAEQERKLAEQAVGQAERESQQAAAALNGAESALWQAEQVLDQASQDLAGLQDKHRAAVLRSHLKPGDLCPVCGQPVVTPPAAQPLPALEEAERKKSAAEQARKNALSQRNRASEQWAQLQAKRQSACEFLEKSEEQLARARQKFEQAIQALTQALNPFACPENVLLEDFVEAEFQAWDWRKAEYEKLAQQLVEAQQERIKAEGDLGIQTQNLKMQEIEVERTRRGIQEAEQAIERLTKTIEEAGSEDPVLESQQLEACIARIEERYRHSKHQHEQALERKNQAEIKAASAQATLEAVLSELAALSQAAEQAWRAAGFRDELDVRSAARSLDQLEKLEKIVQQYEAEISEVSLELKNLERELGEATTTAAEVEQTRLEVEQAEDFCRRLHQEIGRLESEIRNLEGEIEEAAKLRASISEHERRHVILTQLAKDLRSDQYQNYVLESLFSALVEGASRRLRQLNERYDLVFKDNSFYVADHDFGGELRLADTLSGGETFLVSLALALELSEQIQQKQGSVRLDSLFIDEGFGTLDPENLDLVAGAIENLSRADRIIGVITHVAELHQRLPRYEVRPGVQGSEVRYVED